MKYTKKQIAECKTYLGFGYKEGYFDLEMCEDLIKRKAWKEIYDLMDYGDAMADRGDDSAKYEVTKGFDNNE